MATALSLQHLALGLPSQTKLPLPPSALNPPHRLCFSPTHRKSREVRTGFVVAHVATHTATLYDRLELSPNVGLSDIKRAYRQMARRYHPDVCPSNRAEESTRRFIEIQEAYETLSDPRRRAVYDHAVAMGRGSAITGRMPWSPADKDCETADWKGQWESQLHELRRQSFVRERQANSWAARMRRKNGQ